MSFQKLWKEVERTGLLPNTAIIEIPDNLSDDIKQRVRKMSPDVAAGMFLSAIEEVNHGSTKSIDTLVDKQMRALGY